MSEQLKSFVKKVNEPGEFQDKFKADKDGTMADYGLSDDEQQLIRDGNCEEINNRCGEDVVELRPIITYHIQ